MLFRVLPRLLPSRGRCQKAVYEKARIRAENETTGGGTCASGDIKHKPIRHKRRHKVERKTQKKEHGGVYQLRPGVWGYRITKAMPDGTRRQKRSTRTESGETIITRAQAERERKRALAHFSYTAKTESTGKPARARTFREAWADFMETGTEGKASGTIRKHAAVWEHHIAPAFSVRRMDATPPADINAFLLEKYQTYAHGYVTGMAKTFYLLYGREADAGRIPADVYNAACVSPVTKIKAPPRRRDDIAEPVRVYTESELTALDMYFSGRDLETLYLLGRYAGLRISEACGLMWKDIDPEQGVLHIRRQLIDRRGEWWIDALKTRNARRDVIAAAPLLEHLARREHVPEGRQRSVIVRDGGAGIPAAAFVCTRSDGQLTTPNSMKYHAREIEKRCGFSFRYHDLRHTYGSALAAAGIPEHILARQMGHGSTRVTHQYYIGMTQRAADAVRAALLF